MIIEIAVALMAVTFLVLAFFIIRTLRTLREALHQTNHTLAQVEINMGEISGETEKLLHSSSQLMDDIHGKLQRLDPLFTASAAFGDSVKQIAGSVKRVSETISQSTQEIEHAVHTHQKNISEVMEWASTGWQLWNKFQTHRNAKKHQEEGAEHNG